MNPTTPFSISPSSIPTSISVHNLTAIISLNSPEADLIPVEYLRKANASPAVHKKPWIFRSGVQDGRQVDISRWSSRDIAYRGVFRTLQKVPKFKTGLFDTVDSEARVQAQTQTEDVSAEELEKTAKYQDQAVYALLSEVFDMMDIKRMDDDVCASFLRPRLVNIEMEYLTGYRGKYKDGPTTGGFISLAFNGVLDHPRMIVPVSTTKHEEPLSLSLEGCFKLLLAQLVLHIQHLRPPGDKLPDQEIFLIGLHGSNLYILRGYFPGRKTSLLWCGRSSFGADSSASASPINTPDPPPPPSHQDRKENINELEEILKRLKLSNPAPIPKPDPISNPNLTLQNEDPQAFHLHSTKSYNLWLSNEFHSAIRTLAALNLYLMSGQAKCGYLQKTLERFPYTCINGHMDSSEKPPFTLVNNDTYRAGIRDNKSQNGSQSHSHSQAEDETDPDSQNDAEAQSIHPSIRTQLDSIDRELREVRRSRDQTLARARARGLILGQRYPRILTRSSSTNAGASTSTSPNTRVDSRQVGRRRRQRQRWDWLLGERRVDTGRDDIDMGMDLDIEFSGLGLRDRRDREVDEDVILNSTCMSGRPD